MSTPSTVAAPAPAVSWRHALQRLDNRLLPPEKASKTLKVGEFTKARIVGTQGHDLVAQPI